MDATITYDEVVALVGINIPTLIPCPNFEQIQSSATILSVHCNATHAHNPPPPPPHGWKGMVMAREISYALLTTMPFHLPNDPGDATIYVFLALAGQPVNTTLLTRMEQATIDTQFARAKHCFLPMRNIKRACFTALDASINYAFKVSNDPTIQGWHAGMRVIDILDQLSMVYGQPTLAILETNNAVFRSPYLAADTPKVYFR
jgi:hypothetical protein